jgi:hypothetical protein
MKKKTIHTILRIIFGLGISIIAVVMMIFSISMLIASCNSPKHKTIEVSVLGDVTEKLLAQPNPSETLPLFHLNADPLDGAEFSYANMSDVSLNRRTAFSLAQGGNSITTNQFDRKREVQKFEKSVTGFFDSLSTDTIGRDHSSVYLAIVQELNRLAKSKADRKILLVYSDLMENTQSVSFYDKRMISLLHSSPNTISGLLFSQLPIQNISGIEVHFVYQPKNANDDNAFRVVSGFYKKILEAKGAIVFISANLINQ